MIDQGADDTTNAVSIRAFFARTASVRRHRAHRRGHDHPDPAPGARGEAAGEGQILVYQVPIPEPLALLGAPRAGDTTDACACGLRADARQTLRGRRAGWAGSRLPTLIRYGSPAVMSWTLRRSPSSTIPKMHRSVRRCNYLGPGREKRIYAIPPFTEVVSLDFEDLSVLGPNLGPALWAVRVDHASYLDEVVIDDRGGRLFCCSDTDFCRSRREADISTSRQAHDRSATCCGSAASTKAFGQALSALRPTSFTIFGQGEVLAVVGESGSGKTTLLNASGRSQVEADTGSVDVSHVSSKAARCRPASPARRGRSDGLLGRTEMGLHPPKSSGWPAPRRSRPVAISASD